jgi:hypothetical protein
VTSWILIQILLKGSTSSSFGREREVWAIINLYWKANYYGLNGHIPSLYVETMLASVMVFGEVSWEVITSREWSPHDGISAFARRDMRKFAFCMCAPWKAMWRPKQEESPYQDPDWFPVLLPWLQTSISTTMKNKCLSHTVCYSNWILPILAGSSWYFSVNHHPRMHTHISDH